MVRIKWRFDLTLILCLAHLTRIEADSRFSFSFFKSSSFQIIWQVALRRRSDLRLGFAIIMAAFPTGIPIGNHDEFRAHLFLIFDTRRDVIRILTRRNRWTQNLSGIDQEFCQKSSWHYLASACRTTRTFHFYFVISLV